MVSIGSLNIVEDVIMLTPMRRLHDPYWEADPKSFSYLLHPLLGNLAKCTFPLQTFYLRRRYFIGLMVGGQPLLESRLTLM